MDPGFLLRSAEVSKMGEGVSLFGVGTPVSISTLGFVYRVLDVWVDAVAHQDDLLLIKRLYHM